MPQRFQEKARILLPLSTVIGRTLNPEEARSGASGRVRSQSPVPSVRTASLSAGTCIGGICSQFKGSTSIAARLSAGEFAQS